MKDVHQQISPMACREEIGVWLMRATCPRQGQHLPKHASFHKSVAVGEHWHSPLRPGSDQGKGEWLGLLWRSCCGAPIQEGRMQEVVFALQQ